jgi:integrase
MFNSCSPRVVLCDAIVTIDPVFRELFDVFSRVPTGARADEIAVQGKRGMLARFRPTLRAQQLRHNFSSHLASNGVSLQVVGKLLGHTRAATTMRYAHLQDARLRDAANQFGRIFEQQEPKAGKRRA